MRARMAALLAILLLSVGALPATATSPASWGSVARCRYATVAPGSMELRRLVVTPPVELSEPSIAGDRYGWRFIVRRTNSSTGNTKVTYRSPIQKDRANSKGVLDFTKMGVDVEVPAWSSVYRVNVRVYSYRRDGSVRWTSSAHVYEVKLYVDGKFAGDDSAFCFGRMQQPVEE